VNRNEGMGIALGKGSGVFLQSGLYLLTADHTLRSAGYSPAKRAAGSGR